MLHLEKKEYNVIYFTIFDIISSMRHCNLQDEFIAIGRKRADSVPCVNRQFTTRPKANRTAKFELCLTSATARSATSHGKIVMDRKQNKKRSASSYKDDA